MDFMKLKADWDELEFLLIFSHSELINAKSSYAQAL